ncbi:hypothetical protein DPMN_146489 [Dreissena polymorpha]|uniref:Uncharacterized protein n=1 Tax=Dreissena polymorpha TaxID=45954 RepID=A0A9D4F751_DREPO|nr:hypothetical protein DPMN_146489 [Dreissena polymorpha]
MSFAPCVVAGDRGLVWTPAPAFPLDYLQVQYLQGRGLTLLDPQEPIQGADLAKPDPDHMRPPDWEDDMFM